ncbi:MAG: 2-amino-4-hydroxy-6-hydroxymethyldihydropteridine diphosphokinase [Acidobacteria bacterium]|nr:MAG: 2-amino-4-hydroxy-6-hydroxymethyldihydropteridine diphosphokinase [Acidobacteriota bacterium]
MTKVVLAFGSNVGNRVGQIQEAIDKLVDSGLRCEAISHCYESKAVGLRDQPDFVNAVGKFTCRKCSPFEILRLISRIEVEMGRIRTIEKGPRNIDIDLIFFGGSTIATNNLTVPHEAYSIRRFVLEPLHELMPDFQPPGMNSVTISGLLEKCPDVESIPVRINEICQIPAD